ncbi:MAG: protein arginine kinase [candidate division KSB1 bacterium]|nr:protein arginine kinase [candidate division KSB1 bacterium]MDZ7304436.1 protein arginine kinase [candidate division KSB1 bacterium]MDZ7310929.1 protein arginine kinase [candidate division KSB1 bacterium]
MKSDPFKTATATWLESSRMTAQNLNSLVKRLPRWLDSDAPHSDIVITTRVRLARNLADYPFPNAANREQLEEIVQEIYRVLAPSPLLGAAMFLDMQKLGKLERKFLVERRLISPAYAESLKPAMLAVGEDEYLSLMVNEEDHLRIQSIQPGLNVEEAWRLIMHLDDALGEQLDYAFTDQFGYLTACPTNTGTGMRVSLFVHLPALAMLEEIERVIAKLAPSEITVRGFYGEGTEVVGNIFQISNQLTLGRTDDNIIKRMEEVAHKLLSLEADARDRLLNDQLLQLEDRIWRAVGILKYARMISSLEFLNLLSYLRLGMDLGIIKNVNRSLLNELMVVLQPAHLQKTYRDAQEDLSRDVRRVQLVREKIGVLL